MSLQRHLATKIGSSTTEEAYFQVLLLRKHFLAERACKGHNLEVLSHMMAERRKSGKSGKRTSATVALPRFLLRQNDSPISRCRPVTHSSTVHESSFLVASPLLGSRFGSIITFIPRGGRPRPLPVLSNVHEFEKHQSANTACHDDHCDN